MKTLEMANHLSVTLLFAVVVVGQALTPSTFLTTLDQNRLKSVFEAAHPFTDVTNAHYGILGLSLLGSTVPNAQEACKNINSNVDKTSIASLYHASSAAKHLTGCKLNVGDVQSLLEGAIKSDGDVVNIFHAVFALKNLGLKVDNKKTLQTLEEALKKDDSALSYGYSFQIAAELSGSKFFDHIEDVIAQADEVDDKYLQFEGGLYVTSFIIDSAYKLGTKLNKAPTISADKVIKFSNYFLTRKHIHQLRAAAYFLSAIKTLADNKFHVPLAVTLASPVAVSKSQPVVQVRVTNLMGGSLGSLKVVADNAKNIGEGSVVLNKKPFTENSKDKSLFELNMLDSKPAKGFYEISISATPSKTDKRLLGTTGAIVKIKVTTTVSLEGVEIGVADKDQTSVPRSTNLQYPKRSANVLEADFHQKIVMKFKLLDKTTSQSLSAHQTFVRFTNQKTKQEIIFVAESDSSNLNKFELDVGARGKDFGFQSGQYGMELIIGDPVIENPISWTMADVKLTFQEGQAKTKPSTNQYSKKPEIQHQFNKPEKRPPAVVSLAFSGLVLLPVLILFILWIKLGVNISNFPVSLSAIGFHVCLAAIFGLYYCYWTQLNMFQTLRWLGILAVPTFLFGNRLLSGLASKRKTV
ncbi:hypothetical protein LOTGIDRAFT_220939 [Lottia gigantea]|uniref:Dolichyl-diphosphooligosaccharide--protein glycosyltransferase subunit 2 n=1 Tax=Lottia gigantea TaxID=225164 RepID=V3ZNV9_LOTGI|nr:hypothetical protein LOTGIDRAFT_220939 [Lottia gigantea]ESO85997.1 hypothetical protein LOTGIDRAFT_220939 [Lottia gigantea]